MRMYCAARFILFIAISFGRHVDAVPLWIEEMSLVPVILIALPKTHVTSTTSVPDNALLQEVSYVAQHCAPTRRGHQKL